MRFAQHSLPPHKEVHFEIGLLIRQFNLLELEFSAERVSRETSIWLCIRLHTHNVVVVRSLFHRAVVADAAGGGTRVLIISIGARAASQDSI